MGNTFNNVDNENKTKMLIAIGVSMVFLTIWNFFITPNGEEIEKQQAEQKKIEQIEKQKVEEAKKQLEEKNKTSIKEKKEIFFDTKKTRVAVDVNNNRLSFLTLKDYKLHEKSIKNVVLLDDEHFIETGWFGDVVNNKINWKVRNKTNNSVVLYGSDGVLDFEMKYIFEDNYIIKVQQKVVNVSRETKKISNYSRASLVDTKDRIENSYAYRGVLVMNENNINELNYDKIQKQDIEFKQSKKQGWIGLSDQYWLTALINKNDNGKETTYTARYNKDKNTYQIDFNGENIKTLKSGEVLQNETLIYVGAKNLDVLNKVSDDYKIEKFDKAIDFGMFYFISKPLLIILKKLYKISGNFGVAIILLTILVRMIIFPLANRSYKATAKMKLLSPEMKDLKEKYKDNKQEMQKATMELYKKYKINPMSAILPMFLQIPIFFALYKVLVIAIEMRDAPFVGWIVDLSSADPSSFANLFGLLSFEVPQFLQIGLLPCIMGLTMFIQQKMTPNMSIDKTQQKLMNWLPVIFTFMFAGMPAGLVLYWSCSNVFSIIQQSVLLKVVNKESK